MKTTLTVRLDERQREELRRRAKLLGKTDSELVREILDRELSQEPLGKRVEGLAGRIALARRVKDPWGQQIRARNWRK